jgi:hypothetical protein
MTDGTDGRQQGYIFTGTVNFQSISCQSIRENRHYGTSVVENITSIFGPKKGRILQDITCQILHRVKMWHFGYFCTLLHFIDDDDT